ncbi:MAG: helix-turn-helix transcriptional regulator, partial [Ethanoligenens sp.]
MPYTDEMMNKTKERIQDLRKEHKWTYEALAMKLYERDEHIDRNTLWAFEVDDPDHPKYQRTRKMRVKQLVALAEMFDVSVKYLLGISDYRKREYQGIGKELNLTPAAVDQLKS